MLIIFDLDGTLLDSAPDLCATLDQVLIQSGRKALPFTTSRALIGNGIRSLVKSGFEVDGSRMEHEELTYWLGIYFDLYRQNMTNSSILYPGAIELLSNLRQCNHTLALCTNKDMELTETLMEHYAIDTYFAIVVGGNTLTQKKPHPQPLLHCCQTLNIPTEHSLMVGDGINDIEAARRGNIRSVLITHGYRTQTIEELCADYAIDRLCQLAPLLSTLKN